MQRERQMDQGKKKRGDELNMGLVHIVPIMLRLSNRQLSHQLSLPEILDFGMDQLSQTLEVNAALGS